MFELGIFIILQIATLFVLLGGGAVIRFALIATCAPALVVAAVAVGETTIVVVEIIVVGKNFLLDPLREMLTPDEVPYPTSHEAVVEEQPAELPFEGKAACRRRLKEEKAKFAAEVLAEVLEEKFVKEQLHGFEPWRFGALLPQARKATIAFMDRALAEDEDPDLKRIRGLLVQEHLHAGRREAALACV